MKRTERFELRIAKEGLEACQQAAKIVGKPLSEVIRDLLSAWVKATLAKQPLPRDQWCPACHVNMFIRPECDRCNRRETA